jgi:hypothetical protein
MQGNDAQKVLRILTEEELSMVSGGKVGRSTGVATTTDSEGNITVIPGTFTTTPSGNIHFKPDSKPDR